MCGNVASSPFKVIGVDAGADGERADVEQQERMAVGLGLGDHFGADVAARPGFVIHHDRLLPDVAQLLADRARKHIGGAARRERHDDADRLAGEGRRSLRRGGSRKREQGACDNKAYPIRAWNSVPPRLRDVTQIWAFSLCLAKKN
jgi:hypothetical protein